MELRGKQGHQLYRIAVNSEPEPVIPLLELTKIHSVQELSLPDCLF